MNASEPTELFHSWTPLRKVCFRFIATYSAMYMFYTLVRFQTIPGLSQLHRFLWPLWRSIVVTFNDHLLHIRPTLIDPNGSTDTSFSWASLYTMLLISVVITFVWTIIDRKRGEYDKAEYWLRTSVRYFIAYFALYYGIIKLFALQMPSPSPGQLATTLGDFSPTRLAWMFIGASTSYQVFSGVIETAAGLFLIYRRTITLGSILSVAVFGNVVALNFAYDIPVKLMSLHFLVMSVYLLMFESRRLVDFFLNRATLPTNLYEVRFEGRAKYAKIIAKLAFVYVGIIAVVMLSIRSYRSQHLEVNTKPIRQGFYDVKTFVVTGDSLINDSLKWHDLALYGVTGSIKTADTIFEQRYKRAYFSFEVDTVAKQFKMKRRYDDTTYIASLNYKVMGSEMLRLNGQFNGRNLMVIFRKRKEPYRLARPNQFHWLQEKPQ
jgi:hypothetical protein